MSIIAFLYVISRRRIYFYVAAPIVTYLGLSFFVTYMGQRAEIRELVWHEHAGMMERLDRISKLVTDFHLLDFDEQMHLAQLDDRLNQNYLVGAGVMYHRAGMVELAYGGTIPAWSLVPRAIWPDKPTIGGGGDVVSAFTGISFNKETSVGAGQVLEFYINFGTPGVVIGFVILGLVLMWLDCKIMSALAEANMRELILYAVPGLILLQPGGNLLEIFVSLVAGILMSRVIAANRFFQIPSTALAPPRNSARSLRGMGMIGRR